MSISRRTFIAMTSAAAVSAAFLPVSSFQTPTGMYGLIGKMNTAPGQRDALIDILLESTEDMPGCLSYIVAKDADDPDAIWITEVWESQESHQASLSLPAVQDAMTRGRPLITGFGERFETVPIGGHGLIAE